MDIIRSFPPVARPDAQILILGSMPGKKSLAEQQYYAHPRNTFWRIAGSLFKFNPELPYEQRTLALVASRVALWDVMAACKRRSSLDSDIVESTIVANDFAGFHSRHPNIRMVGFNGLKAAQAYRKFVEPGLPQGLDIETRSLPSTSPANARLTFDQKMTAWRGLVSTL